MIWKMTFRHIKKRPFSSFLTVVAIALALGLLGGFWTVSENLESIHVVSDKKSESSGKSTLSVFVDPTLSNAQVDALVGKLKSFKKFSQIKVTSDEESKKRLEEQFGETLTKALGSETLPISIQLNFENTNLKRNEWIHLLNEIRALNGVLDVDDASSILPENPKELSNNIFSWSTILLIAVFLIVALLVSHLVRMVFEGNREEIETMKILGGPKFWIFMPLLFEGLLFGFMGACLAVASVNFLVFQVLPQYSEILLPKGMVMSTLSLKSTLTLIGMGIAAAISGAIFTWPAIQAAPKEL